MGTTIEGVINLRIDDGMSKKIPIFVDIHAHDIVNGTIPNGPSDTTVGLQPSGEKGNIKFLRIRGDNHYNCDKLTYKTFAGAAALSLKCAHVIIGNSLTPLLNDEPTDLKFHSGTGDQVNTQAFVRHDAISTPGGL